ncbi:hypothetical protein V501_04145 [Pseudogymnoascus sp. VKM F-4519 (FW-2642)]|nr:hypothetical protein V501_04145 [Pseudogymnoascus sp. VKM F-4519 (FW-2642)]
MRVSVWPSQYPKSQPPQVYPPCSPPERHENRRMSSRPYSLAALTRPRAEDDHEHRAADLQGPPEPVPREAVGVERDEDEVHDVQGYDEVEDEFGALDYEEDRYDTVRLQRQDLGEDAQRRELGQGAGARGAPSPWERHACVCDAGLLETSAGLHVSGVDDVVGETKLLIGKLDLGDDYSIPITQDIVIEQQGNYTLSTRPDRPATPSSHTKTTKTQATEKSGLSTTASYPNHQLLLSTYIRNGFILQLSRQAARPQDLHGRHTNRARPDRAREVLGGEGRILPVPGQEHHYRQLDE